MPIIKREELERILILLPPKRNVLFLIADFQVNTERFMFIARIFQKFLRFSGKRNFSCDKGATLCNINRIELQCCSIRLRIVNKFARSQICTHDSVIRKSGVIEHLRQIEGDFFRVDINFAERNGHISDNRRRRPAIHHHVFNHGIVAERNRFRFSVSLERYNKSVRIPLIVRTKRNIAVRNLLELRNYRVCTSYGIEGIFRLVARDHNAVDGELF